MTINDGTISTPGRNSDGTYGFDVAGRSVFINAGDAILYAAPVHLGYQSAFINTGNVSLTYSDVSGPHSSRLVNEGTIGVVQSETVSVPVSGSGTFEVNGYFGDYRQHGTLEFAASVAARVKVALSGAGPATLVLDEPSAFHGSITYEPFVNSLNVPVTAPHQVIDLPNITVTSETFANEELRLFDLGKLVAKLNIIGDYSPANFSIGKSPNNGTGSDILFTPTADLPSSTATTAAVPSPTMPVPLPQS